MSEFFFSPLSHDQALFVTAFIVFCVFISRRFYPWISHFILTSSALDIIHKQPFIALYGCWWSLFFLFLFFRCEPETSASDRRLFLKPFFSLLKSSNTSHVSFIKFSTCCFRHLPLILIPSYLDYRVFFKQFFRRMFCWFHKKNYRISYPIRNRIRLTAVCNLSFTFGQNVFFYKLSYSFQDVIFTNLSQCQGLVRILKLH